MKIIITERQKKLIKENEDFTKEIAKDLFKRLPKNNFSEDDFLEYMKEKGSPDSITNEVLGHLESMGFPFEIRKPKKSIFVNDDSEEYEKLSDDPNDWYFDIYIGNDPNDYWDRTRVFMTLDPDGGIDTEVGSHNVPRNILNALEDCGFDPNDTEDGHWYLKSDFNHLTKQKLIKRLSSEGFNYIDLDM